MCVPALPHQRVDFYALGPAALFLRRWYRTHAPMVSFMRWVVSCIAHMHESHPVVRVACCVGVCACVSLWLRSCDVWAESTGVSVSDLSTGHGQANGGSETIFFHFGWIKHFIEIPIGS